MLHRRADLELRPEDTAVAMSMERVLIGGVVMWALLGLIAGIVLKSQREGQRENLSQTGYIYKLVVMLKIFGSAVVCCEFVWLVLNETN